jgi:hypothetical protein
MEGVEHHFLVVFSVAVNLQKGMVTEDTLSTLAQTPRISRRVRSLSLSAVGLKHDGE